jgi:DNA-binding HxlR family transcriptional regulator
VKGNYNFKCNLAQTLNIVEDKWTLLVLHRISNGRNTYKELQEVLSPIPTNILSKRLKTLEENGLIKAELYSEHPPRYAYLLTEKGRDFRHVFNSIIIWSNKYLDSCNRNVKHEKCETDVEIKYYCKSCDEVVDDLIVK